MWGLTNPIMIGGNGYEGYTLEDKYTLVRNSGIEKILLHLQNRFNLYIFRHPEN